MNVVPLFFLSGDEQQHQICAGGKIRGLVRHDHGIKIGGEAFHSGVQHRDDVRAYRVHFGMEFAAHYAIAQINQARAGIFLDNRASFFARFQNDQTGRLGNRFVAGARKIEVGSDAAFGAIKSFAAGGEKLRDQRRHRFAFLHQPLRHRFDAHASHVSNGPSSQLNPQRIARSISTTVSEISGTRRAA